MGWMDTGIAKTRAIASDARADLAETNSQMFPAQLRLTITASADGAVNHVAGSWIGRQSYVQPLVAALGSQTAALRSRAQATLDELTAKQEAARSKLSFAEKSHGAMNRIADETDKIMGD